MAENIDKIKALARNVRILSAEAVEKAKSGHPGLPMGAADYSAVLWANHLNFNPADNHWIARDRFILSAGHGCMLLYSLLHLFGYKVSLDDLKNFRQWESITPGHPEFGITPGVETTTGPLGQGFANGVGIALSSKLLSQTYASELFKYRVFALVSDGDLMEGVTSEAASLAGHLALDNLIYIYDDNHISIGGDTNVCFTESVPKRFEAYGWHVQSVNGNDPAAFEACLKTALLETKRPKLICARTTIGLGSPNKAGHHEVHGAPLGEKELKLSKEALGWNYSEDFKVAEDVTHFCSEMLEKKKIVYNLWQDSFSKWKDSNTELYSKLKQQLGREVPDSLKQDLLNTFAQETKDATRNLSGKAIQVISKHVPFFIGGSADLEPSTKTLISGSADIQASNHSGRNIRFGVREHGMGALVNGLSYSSAWIPYSATFLVFSDYMRPTLRLAAISHLQSLFIFTHDSFWVGEDGPTHQPIEHIASLRLIPNLNVFRPADGIEVAMCYFAALQAKRTPSALLFTRQDVPTLKREASFKADDILKGAYILKEGSNTCQLVLVATGSEVSLALETAQLLELINISARVVSMPCMEIFLAQPREFKQRIIPPHFKKVIIEAGTCIGWERIVGTDALMLGIDHFGASAPGKVLAEKYGFTTPQIKEKVVTWLHAA